MCIRDSPRELPQEQRIELVRDFVRQEAGERHAYSFAIHNPKASIDGGEQPHAHIMMSQRVNDGIERPPDQYFRRYNAKFPERGGAKKDSGNLTLSQQTEQLRALRKRWEDKHNEHMRMHNIGRGFIDCRSLREQGVTRRPEVHLGFEAAARLDETQKHEIRFSRLADIGQQLEHARSYERASKDYQRRGEELVKTLMLDISREHGERVSARVLKSGEVEIEREHTRGYDRGR